MVVLYLMERLCWEIPTTLVIAGRSGHVWTRGDGTHRPSSEVEPRGGASVEPGVGLWWREGWVPWPTVDHRHYPASARDLTFLIRVPFLSPGPSFSFPNSSACVLPQLEPTHYELAAPRSLLDRCESGSLLPGPEGPGQ